MKATQLRNPMRLLVTNDDGIDSVFLRVLVDALREAGHELLVVAPRTEQSWIGAAKSRHRPVASCASAPHRDSFGCAAWIVDGTPSDCVNIALAHLLREGRGDPKQLQVTDLVDGVVSGINLGMNASLGFVIASGTIAGAWEGALHGLPAIAFSQDLSFRTFDKLKLAGGEADPEILAMVRASARAAARIAGHLIPGTPPRSFVVHNVNFPTSCGPATEVVRTVPSHVIVPGLFSPAADDGTHRFVFSQGDDISPPGILTDRRAVAAGKISHTVLDYRRLGFGIND